MDEARLARIDVLALDIDGVLTDGRVTLDEHGRESKSLSYRDIDAVYRARRSGLRVVLVTGEATPWVDVVARRLEIDVVYRGAKDKRATVRRLGKDLGAAPEAICYIGDSARDAGVFAEVGLALAPGDAAEGAQVRAHRVLKRSGGAGAVAEAVEMILAARST